MYKVHTRTQRVGFARVVACPLTLVGRWALAYGVAVGALPRVGVWGVAKYYVPPIVLLDIDL